MFVFTESLSWKVWNWINKISSHTCFVLDSDLKLEPSLLLFPNSISGFYNQAFNIRLLTSRSPSPSRSKWSTPMSGSLSGGTSKCGCISEQSSCLGEHLGNRWNTFEVEKKKSCEMFRSAQHDLDWPYVLIHQLTRWSQGIHPLLFQIHKNCQASAPTTLTFIALVHAAKIC